MHARCCCVVTIARRHFFNISQMVNQTLSHLCELILIDETRLQQLLSVKMSELAKSFVALTSISS